ncbi:MAG: HAMP domain-containing sensor histidine kinase [Pseudomonadota bacterium]
MDAIATRADEIAQPWLIGPGAQPLDVEENPFDADAIRVLRFGGPAFILIFIGETLSHTVLGGGAHMLITPAVSALVTIAATLYGWRSEVATRAAPWLLFVLWGLATVVVVQHLTSASTVAAFIFMSTLMVATPALILSPIPMLLAESATIGLHFAVSARLSGIDVFSLWVLAPLLFVAAAIYVARRSAVQHAERSRQYQLELAARTAAVERLASLNTMAAGIAHHTSNRLQAIMGTADLALRGDDADTREFVEKIWQESTRLANLVVPLRTFAGNAAGARRFVAFGEVIEAAGLRELLDRGVKLDVSLEPNLPELALYGGEIEEMLRCLARNAQEAGATRVEVSVRGSTTGITLKFADDGDGLSDAEMERVLDPFFTTRGPGRLGLGLAYVAGAVRNHSGTLTIDSSPGEGTAVLIELPA